MKTNTLYKRSFNRCLDLLAERPLGPLPLSEAALAARLGVSRTTVRAVLAGLTEAGILRSAGAGRHLTRHPGPQDHFPDPQTEGAAQIVERKFMQMVLTGDYRPGQTINSAELARQFGTSTTAVREYLTRFSQFGLMERRANSGWIFKGVTTGFATEIYEIREMFELRSARRFVSLDDTAPAWAALDTIEREHRDLLQHIDSRYSDFSRLDERLHRLIHEASHNRFIREFYDVISIIFHYHYQWDKTDEKERNIVAIGEHLDYIAALRSRDLRLIDAKCRAHLRSARATMLRSIVTGPLQGEERKPGNGTAPVPPELNPRKAAG